MQVSNYSRYHAGALGGIGDEWVIGEAIINMIEQV